MSKNLATLIDQTISFKGKIDHFNQRATEINEQALSYRAQFYDTILRVVDLISMLADYKIDSAQDAINREPLYFDKTIREQSNKS